MPNLTYQVRELLLSSLGNHAKLKYGVEKVKDENDQKANRKKAYILERKNKEMESALLDEQEVLKVYIYVYVLNVCVYVCMYVSVYACIYICIYIYIYIYRNINENMYMYKHIYICIYIYIYTYLCIYIGLWGWSIW
jgi:hypothetical protein